MTSYCHPAFFRRMLELPVVTSRAFQLHPSVSFEQLDYFSDLDVSSFVNCYCLTLQRYKYLYHSQNYRAEK